MIERAVGYFEHQPRKIFLADGIGGFMSACSLGILFRSMSSYVGMPEDILLKLALVAVAFGLYSIGCFILVRDEWRRWLRIIVYCNTGYCLATAGLLIAFRRELTFAGFAYFLLEILVIQALVAVERGLLQSRS